MTARTDLEGQVAPIGRRVGYVAAAGVNLLFLWIANHLLEWEWPSFLTGEWEDLLPIVQFSLGATIVVNLVWVAYDHGWFRHLAQAGLNLISLVVAAQTWEIFPFDLSDGWQTVFRIVIAIGILGTSIGAITELAKFATELSRWGHPRHGHA